MAWQVKVSPSGPTYNLICNVTQWSAILNLIILLVCPIYFSSHLLFLHHVDTIVGFAIDFSVDAPGIFSVYFHLPSPFNVGGEVWALVILKQNVWQLEGWDPPN